MTNDNGIICAKIREQIDIIDIQLGRQVDAQVRGQVDAQVFYQVENLIRNQLYEKE
jgi:hypothetical protein